MNKKRNTGKNMKRKYWRNMKMWGILIALLSGALMSVQGVFNTELTKQTSLWVSTGWVQISAFLVCVAAWLLRDVSPWEL